MKSFALVLALLPLAASAATITVNTTADNTAAGDGHCTLREAIANVNAAADTTNGDCTAGTGAGDTIMFAFAIPAKIQLDQTLGELTIQRDVTITGPVNGGLQIDGGHKTRVFTIAAGTTSMSNLSIVNGSSIDAGGGIWIDGYSNLALNDCTLSGNSVGGDGNRFGGNGGGAIYNGYGTLTLTNCTLSGNRVKGGKIGPYATGGAVFNFGGTATLINCTLQGNVAAGPSTIGTGGGFYNYGGTATLTDCTFRGNRANSGGGLYNEYGNDTLTNCTFIRNRANNSQYGDGGGIFNTDLSTVTLTNCTLSGNSASGRYGTGGALKNFGTAIHTGCTFSGNRAHYGGGIWNIATARLSNCTFNGNRAYYGDAIYNRGSGTFYPGAAMLTNCTLSGNKAHYGGALSCFSNPGDAVSGFTLTNTIITDSGAYGNCRNDGCPFTSGGHNLSSDGTCGGSGSTDLLSTDPHLGRLGNYGGATQTMPPCTGPGIPKASCHAASAAIDAGDDSVTGPPDDLTTDQRGLPRLSGAHVDIGAYEVQ